MKPEGLQPIGAFKLRGGYNKIASLTPEERARGVIAFSSGNHAQGVAYAARSLGIDAVIVMPARAPEIKRVRTEALGAEVVLLHEGGEEEWLAHAEALAQARGLKLGKPEIKVVGVEPELANDAQLSFRRGEIVALPIEQTRETVADGMRATQVGNITFRYIREYVDDIVTVAEDEIRAGVRELALGSRLVVEPSGAVTAAALFKRRDELPAAQTVVAVLSGGNIEPGMLADILVDS